MINKLLNIEEANYSSNLNEEDLKKKMKELFKEGASSMTGKITNENEFTAHDKQIVIGWSMPNLKRRAAYLKGKITPAENGILINLIVKPNSFLPLLAILFTLMGAIITSKALFNTVNDSFFLIFGIVFMTLGFIYYPLSTFLKNRLRNKIVNYLDLNRV